MKTWHSSRVPVFRMIMLPNIKALPIFRCWQEDWEIRLQKNKDPITQAKFQNKYGGICFYDVDETKYDRLIETGKVAFNKREGYLINCKASYDGTYKDDDPEPWTFKCIIECLLMEKIIIQTVICG